MKKVYHEFKSYEGIQNFVNMHANSDVCIGRKGD